MTLFEIVGEFQQLYDIACEEPDSEAFADTLEALTGELEEKSTGYVAVINRLDMEAKKAAELEKKFSDIKKSRENAIKRMKQTLLTAMDLIEKTEIPAGDFKIKIQKNGGKQPVKIDDDLVPDNFRKVVLEIDKDKIRKALEDGEELSFAHLEERGRHISIK